MSIDKYLLPTGPAAVLGDCQAPVPLDDRIIQLWQQGMARSTRINYSRDVARFLRFTGKGLLLTTFPDLADYADSLLRLGYKDRSRRCMLAAIKSLLKFCHGQGWSHVNVGVALRLPRIEDDLDERIIEQETVLAMIESEPILRNLLILVLLYYGGLRLSELASLRWKHVNLQNREGCTLKVRGKGGRTRFVAMGDFERQLLRTWFGECQGPKPDLIVIPLCTRQIDRVVRTAARRAAAPREVSPHLLRHAHASHSQDNGERPHVVQRTLGHSDLRMTTHYSHIQNGVGSGRSLLRPRVLALLGKQECEGIVAMSASGQEPAAIMRREYSVEPFVNCYNTRHS